MYLSRSCGLPARGESAPCTQGVCTLYLGSLGRHLPLLTEGGHVIWRLGAQEHIQAQIQFNSPAARPAGPRPGPSSAVPFHYCSQRGWRGPPTGSVLSEWEDTAPRRRLGGRTASGVMPHPPSGRPHPTAMRQMLHVLHTWQSQLGEQGLMREHDLF